MKLTVSLLLLVAICHVSEVNSSRSLPKTEGEANPTVKRTLLDSGYGLEAALYKKGLIHPGLGHIDPHHPHHYGGLHHDPHLAHAALAGLYGPLSPYHHLKLDYSPLGHHHGHHSHHDNDNDERESSDEDRESERPKSEKSSKKSKSKKSKRPSSKSSSRSEKNEEKHRSHHEHDEHKYLEYTHLGYPHPLLYPNHHLYPHLRAGLHYPYHHQPYYQPHLGLGHPGLYNPYVQPLQYVQHSVEQQVIPGAQYTQDGQPQQYQQQVQPQIQQPVQQQQQQQQLVQRDVNLQGAANPQNPQAQAQSAVSYASFSQSLPQSYQPQVPQPVIQGQLYPQQLQVLQTQPLFQLLGVEPVYTQQAQLLLPTPAPQQSLQSQPPNLFPESPQPVTQATLLQPIPTQPTVQTTSLIASPSEESPVVTIKPTTQEISTSTQQVVEIQSPKAPEVELKQEADNSINNSRAYLTPLFSQTQEIVIQDPQLPAVSTIAPAYYGK